MSMVTCTPIEIGHNWGSFHDPPEDGCENQFLMYQFAHNGDNPNNFVSILQSKVMSTVTFCKKSIHLLFVYRVTSGVVFFFYLTLFSAFFLIFFQDFSNCSKEMIGEVLSTKGNCFTGRYTCDLRQNR